MPGDQWIYLAKTKIMVTLYQPTDMIFVLIKLDILDFTLSHNDHHCVIIGLLRKCTKKKHHHPRSVFEIVGKFQYQGQNRAHLFCYCNIVRDCDMLFVIFLKIFFNVP